MDARQFKRSLINKNKRPPEKVLMNRPTKRPSPSVRLDCSEKTYGFRVLLPNGTTLGLKIRERDDEMPVEKIVQIMKQEYSRQYPTKKSNINWESESLCLIDAFDIKIRNFIDFSNFETNKVHILRLRDGSKEAESYENMWDLTPDTDLLKELPEEYTFETALADLIDNSLQAVWSNPAKGRKMICVNITEEKISIFDNGAGMDGSEENSIAKWGKMGASLHRSSRGQAIGGTPPYLTPFFGMFGYGGPIASMHLGRHALVSSKTRESKKVYTLSLSREALLRARGSEHSWKTNGGLRESLEEELEMSPRGCFTKVEIFEPKLIRLNIRQLRCRLKDIYFPYIQYDEVSNQGRTTTLIDFQVNGRDLAEIEGGEVAITNLQSCNGPEFVLHLHLNQLTSANTSESRTLPEANALVKCVYFPIVEGKESIEMILEKLKEDKCGIKESFESFSRVSIRRLGRLLPAARWPWLPFMEPPRHRAGEKSHKLKRCCPRVKCFIETDAGFNPTPSKTDLAPYHLFTKAIKQLGTTQPEKDKDLHVEIYRDGKELPLAQLEKQYQDWVLQMHDLYDKEIDGGEDQPILIISPPNKKKLCISSDVLRVHKVLRRKGKTWKSEQRIKILKGAYAGCHKNHVYATIECFLIEGFQGDVCGEARMICRPLSVTEENGCLLSTDKENPTIDIRECLSLPISVIDSEKCLMVVPGEWNTQVERLRGKSPAVIDFLSPQHCRILDIEEALPLGEVVDAGHVPPKEIVAVLRPTSFVSGSAKNLDQRDIVKGSYEMSLEIKYRAKEEDQEDKNHIYSRRILPSSRQLYGGLYIFPLDPKLQLFQRSGLYTFSLSLRDSDCRNLVKRVKVNALSEIKEWGLSSYDKSQPEVVRVGSCFPPVLIVGFDEYKNQTPFSCVPELMVKISSDNGVLGQIDKIDAHLSTDKSVLKVKNSRIESRKLDRIRPSYEATLIISSKYESLSVSIPFQVIPGLLYKVKSQVTRFDEELTPGSVIKELVLEMFDRYGNHMRADSSIVLEVDGLSLLDKESIRKVDDQGCVDLSGLLKVEKGYGGSVSLSVISNNKEAIFSKKFQTEKRELKLASQIPRSCEAGSQLENIVFEIINTEGVVDESIHDNETRGESHTITINIDESIKYSFRRGRCTVPSITLPREEGKFYCVASHSRYPELRSTIEVRVVQGLFMEPRYLEYKSPDRIMSPLEESPPRLTTRRETYNDDDAVRQVEYPDRNMFLLPHSSDVQTPLNSVLTEDQERLKEILDSGVLIENREKNLESLRLKKVKIEQDLCELQEAMDSGARSHTSEKEAVMKKIEVKYDSAAAVVCSFSKQFQAEEHDHRINRFKNSVLGVVALLGTVKSISLSRILAQYLGEDQMLAVVCKSFGAAAGLHTSAAELGKHIKGHCTIICLEDISPYSGKVNSDPQRTIVLSDPVMRSGMPSGFVGYAVNMINIEEEGLFSYSSRFGLRETLFYRLFGELQVYQTLQQLEYARPCWIKNGAVSLDGGIFRGNGIISLKNSEPDVVFPVVKAENQLRQVQEKRMKHSEMIKEIEREKRMLETDKNHCKKKHSEYEDFLDKIRSSPIPPGA